MADHKHARYSGEGCYKVGPVLIPCLKGKTHALARSNHGSFYFNQLAALQILVDDKAGASSTIQEYFNGIFMNQIVANGDQVSKHLFIMQMRFTEAVNVSPSNRRGRVHTTTVPTISLRLL